MLRNVLILLVRLVGTPGAYLAARQARKPVPERLRILLVRPDYLGDLIMTTPILSALKQQIPNAHITMLVGPWSAEIVERHPAVDRVITCSFPNLRNGLSSFFQQYMLLLRMAYWLRKEHYDLAINLRHNYWWGAALLYLARVPHRIGYANIPHTGKPFLTEVLPSSPQEHLSISALRLCSAGLQALGYAPLATPYTPERYPSFFQVTEAEQQWVEERLSAAGIDSSAPIVVIHPGAGERVKMWRAEAWATCAAFLARSSLKGVPIRVVLTGSKQEQSLLDTIARQAGTPVFCITGMTIGQLAALLHRAEFVLGLDSGPLHLATAQATPTIRIFGPTKPLRSGPWGSPDRHIVLCSTHRCPSCPTIPCGRLVFPPGAEVAHPCVRLVPEQAVLDAISRQLSDVAQLDETLRPGQ